MFKVRLPGMVFLLLLTLILILTGCTSPGEGEGAAPDQLPPEEGEGEPAETNSEEPAESGTVPPGPREGQAAPDFTLSDPEGETYSLADFHGQVVALTFGTAAAATAFGNYPFWTPCSGKRKGRWWCWPSTSVILPRP